MTKTMSVWWSCLILFAIALALAGCDSPSPKFMGLTARQVTVDRSLYSVRHTVFEAEAIRLSGEVPPHRSRAVLQAARAIEIASECEVLRNTLDGDANVVRADIDCPGAPERPWKPPAPLELDCSRVGGIGGEDEFDCVVW